MTKFKAVTIQSFSSSSRLCKGKKKSYFDITGLMAVQVAHSGK